jgi:hypothetical protein
MADFIVNVDSDNMLLSIEATNDRASEALANTYEVEDDKPKANFLGILQFESEIDLPDGEFTHEIKFN